MTDFLTSLRSPARPDWVLVVVCRSRSCRWCGEGVRCRLVLTSWCVLRLCVHFCSSRAILTRWIRYWQVWRHPLLARPAMGIPLLLTLFSTRTTWGRSLVSRFLLFHITPYTRCGGHFILLIPSFVSLQYWPCFIYLFEDPIAPAGGGPAFATCFHNFHRTFLN